MGDGVSAAALWGGGDERGRRSLDRSGTFIT